MSYDLIVYARRAEIPDGTELSRRLGSGLPPVALLGGYPDILAAAGFHTVIVGREKTGFEIASSSITEGRQRCRRSLAESGEEDTGFLKVLSTCDTEITFACRDENEVRAGRIVAAALASASRGYLYDPQAGQLVGDGG